MNHAEAAAETLADFEKEFGADADEEFGKYLVACANARASRLQRLAQLREEFMKAKEAELQAYIAQREAEALEAATRLAAESKEE